VPLAGTVMDPSGGPVPGPRCAADDRCERPPCFRVEVRDCLGGHVPGQAMVSCAEHHGSAAEELRRAARARGITGGYLRVAVIDATLFAPADGATPAGGAPRIASFMFTRIPIDP
jgi:hypothetical protein